jgi:uncharacterized membrane protein
MLCTHPISLRIELFSLQTFLSPHLDLKNMYEWFKFLHLSAGIVWLGGMALVILALRPVAIKQLPPPERLTLMSGVLTRFFALIFAHIWFVPFRRLKAAVAISDWPAAGKALGQIHPLVLTNFVLGWLAVLAVIVWR